MKEDDKETRKLSEEELQRIREARIQSQQTRSLESISLEDTTDDTVKEGSTFGHYLLGRKLGEGGMGSVFKAKDKAKRESVALKVIKDDLFQEGKRKEYVERFLREAKILSMNSNPNLVSLRDFGKVEGHFYYAMDLIRGEDLRSLINKYGPLGIIRSIRMAKSIAGALLSIHEEGVLHRDVKPENIMANQPMTPQEVFILIDCGIAKFMYGMPTLTSIGAILGTPEHISPEYAQGLPIDERSDIYSLNTVLYEALCSFSPFVKEKKESVYEFLKRIINEKPKPVIDLNTMVPPELDAVVEKGMAKDPNDRYQDGKEYIAALEEVEQKI